MDPTLQCSTIEHYEQFRRFVAFLETSFAFIPGVANAEQKTTLEAKLGTIYCSMQADNIRLHQVCNKNKKLQVENKRLRSERNQAASENTRLRHENGQLMSQNTEFIAQNKDLVQVNEDSRAGQKKLQERSLPSSSNGSVHSETTSQPSGKSENAALDRTWQESPRQSQQLDRDYITRMKKENEELITKPHVSESRVKELFKHLTDVGARLKGNRLNKRDLGMEGPKPRKRCHDPENRQNVVSEKQNADAQGPCCAASKITLETHLDKLEERFERMDQSGRKPGSETAHPGKQFKGQGNKDGLAMAGNVDQERLREVEDLRESLARMEKAAADFKRLVDVHEATIKGFDCRMKEQQQQHQRQQDEIRLREQALVALVGPIIQWRESMVSGTSANTD